MQVRCADHLFSAVIVVVTDVLGEHRCQVPLVDDKHPPCPSTTGPWVNRSTGSLGSGRQAGRTLSALADGHWDPAGKVWTVPSRGKSRPMERQIRRHTRNVFDGNPAISIGDVDRYG